MRSPLRHLQEVAEGNIDEPEVWRAFASKNVTQITFFEGYHSTRLLTRLFHGGTTRILFWLNIESWRSAAPGIGTRSKTG